VNRFRLKEVRKTKNLTQEQAADKLGVSIHTYRAYEQNKKNPSYAILIKMRNLFECTVDEII
jgi:DNA-binding XRE family transcriptional regulator